MKVLLVHNDYGKYSGEEAVVDKMAKLFADLGHEVAQLRMSTADARESLGGKIRVFTAGMHSTAGVKAMREALEKHKPDVVNVHNVFPFISPAALRECKRAGVPVVMTVHNFRLICPTGLFMRNGGPCEVCLEKGNEWSCVKYNCEKSMLKSVAYAARNAVARRKRHFLDCVDHFACITDFQRRKLIAAGFPAERISVIPNSMEVSTNEESSTNEELGNAKHSRLPEIEIVAMRNEELGAIPRNRDRRNEELGEGYVAFCGRISHEKGIDLILEAARKLPDVNFKLAGSVDAPELVENVPSNVELLGYVKGKDLEDFYRNAAFVIMASRCYEGFPMAILEAAKYGKATIGPNHGGFTEILEGMCKGVGKEEAAPLLFQAGDAEDLTAKIRKIWDDRELREQLGRSAREQLKRRYSTEVVAQQWQQLLTTLTTDCH